MINSCNIVSSFCSPTVQKRLLCLYDNLNEQGLIPRNISFEQGHFDTKKNNLLFITYNRDNEYELRNLINGIDFKKNHVIIISNDEENYFDFAIEYGICNIICMKKLDETILLGILKTLLKKDLHLEPFFEKEKNTFDKRYSLSGTICINNLVENTFADFIKKIQNNTKNTFIINCHELVTNALAYGVLGITAQTRDNMAYDIGKYIEIPKGKEVNVHLLMNEDLYGISVMDYRGSLTIKRILERIRRQSIVGTETIPQGIEDYSGRGLAVLGHHGVLNIAIKPNEFTVVSLISHLKAGFEKKSISILATEL